MKETMHELENESSSETEEIELQVADRKERKQIVAEKGGSVVWRCANVLMTIFFLMASGVQFNDPDPYLWVPLYGTAVLLTLSVAIWPNSTGDKKWVCMYWIHTAFCTVMFLYVLIELIIVATNPNSDGSLNPLTYEEGREMAGIMITTIWLFTCKQSPTMKSCTRTGPKKDDISSTVFLVSLSVFPMLLWAMCYSEIVDCSVCTDFYVDKYSF